MGNRLSASSRGQPCGGLAVPLRVSCEAPQGANDIDAIVGAPGLTVGDNSAVEEQCPKSDEITTICDPQAMVVDTEARREADSDDDNKMCRYCFEGDESGELIAPCLCRGGQKWVHLSCLRRWQRGVLVNQPTHPDFYDDDVRHRVCGVCKSDFACKPPTRLELMQNFTGEELAAFVEEGCFIGAHRDFSAEMRRQVEPFPPHLREAIVDSHWINGVFLITKVVEDRGVPMGLSIDRQEDIAAFVTHISDDWCWQLRGRLYRLLFEGPLEEVATASNEARRAAVRNLQAPCMLKLEPADEGDCGEDGIMAVGLSRPVDVNCSSHMEKRLQFQIALQKVLPDEQFLPQVTHHLGGPCHESRPQFCIVISHTINSEGYKVYTRLSQAITDAQDLCRERQTSSAEQSQANLAEEVPPAAKRRREESEVTATPSGEHARTMTASTTASSNDEIALLGNSIGASASFEDSSADAASIEGSGETENKAANVRLLIFWGAAGWSRCQLIGEIASGSWGLCKSHETDITALSADELYDTVYPRLVFAPKTEMSETYGQGTVDDVDRNQILRFHRQLRRREEAFAQRQRRRAAEAEQLAAEAGGRLAEGEVPEEETDRSAEAALHDDAEDEDDIDEQSLSQETSGSDEDGYDDEEAEGEDDIGTGQELLDGATIIPVAS
jgi:putative AlgH/UPF0301 family transcriptional regulator